MLGLQRTIPDFSTHQHRQCHIGTFNQRIIIKKYAFVSSVALLYKKVPQNTRRQVHKWIQMLLYQHRLFFLFLHSLKNTILKYIFNIYIIKSRQQCHRAKNRGLLECTKYNFWERLHLNATSRLHLVFIWKPHCSFQGMHLTADVWDYALLFGMDGDVSGDEYSLQYSLFLLASPSVYPPLQLSTPALSVHVRGKLGLKELLQFSSVAPLYTLF